MSFKLILKNQNIMNNSSAMLIEADGTTREVTIISNAVAGMYIVEVRIEPNNKQPLKRSSIGKKILTPPTLKIRIKEFLIDFDKTITDLAKEAKIGVRTIHQIQSDELKTIGTATLDRIENTLVNYYSKGSNK